MLIPHAVATRMRHESKPDSNCRHLAGERRDERSKFVKVQRTTSYTGQRAWFAASVLILTAGLCLPSSSLFGRDEPKAKQIEAIEKELTNLTAKLDELKAE